MLPSKHETFTKCWYNVGPLSTTLAQIFANIGGSSHACWVVNLAFALVSSHYYYVEIKYVYALGYQKQIYMASALFMFESCRNPQPMTLKGSILHRWIILYKSWGQKGFLNLKSSLMFQLDLYASFKYMLLYLNTCYWSTSIIILCFSFSTEVRIWRL